MECPICATGYDSKLRLPKILPCAHTLCSQCITDLSSAGQVLCPTCRAPAQVADVHTNYALRDVLDAGARLPAVSVPDLNASAPPPAMGAPLLAVPPVQQGMVPAPGSALADQALRPWDIGPQNVYVPANDGGVIGQVPPPPPREQGEHVETWKRRRAQVLRDWGAKREERMHRRPKCFMDQMTSGSGLFPVRFLDDSWLLPEEKQMTIQLERLLAGTGRGRDLAWDMLTPIVYDAEVKVVLDNSGSMQLDMFGQAVNYGMSGGQWMDWTGPENPRLMQALLATQRRGVAATSVAPSPINPHKRRWFFARDALRRWMAVFRIIGIDPGLYLLNPMNGHDVLRCSQLEQVFASQPGGSTPMTQVLQRALSDHLGSAPRGSAADQRLLLTLVLTDGEANDMYSFNALLDSCQNGVYGDVQICLLGLSLVPRDVEWFENEECDEIRIRTVEAYEVEARQIRMREVVRREDGYNFEMHSYRSLVTNYYPADYDYEAPLQNFRHRLYITIHGRDRWWGLNNPCWRCACSNLFCTCCFLATGAHCCGWCQGNECGKCQKPPPLEDCCEAE